MSKRKKQKAKKRRWPFVLLLIALILAALIYDSANRITVTDFELSYSELPGSFGGFKIVQLSDLHLKQFGKDNERLLEGIEAQDPDIIALTGDFLNRSIVMSKEGSAEKLRGFFEKLALIAPCYFVSGNHDWASGEIHELAAILEQTGVRYLKNEYVFLEKNGESIILAGVEDPNGPSDMIRPDAFIEKIRLSHPDSFILLLAHRDDWLVKYPELDVQLILAGHAHGGVVRLPGIGGIFSTNHSLFPKYDAGLYNEGGFDFILSRGLGNYNIIPRFLNPPEIVCVTFRVE